VMPRPHLVPHLHTMFNRLPSGEYAQLWVDSAWIGWQAATALQAERVRELEEALAKSQSARKNLNSQGISWMNKANKCGRELRHLKLRAEMTGVVTGEKLCISDFLTLIDKSTSNAQLRLIVELLDVAFREDAVFMRGEDWPIVTAAVSANKDKALSATAQEQGK